jgi:CheY-like chemotaxis protein
MAQILIVENDVALVRALVHVLRNAGHVPIVARDGRSALHAVGAQPDLILFDLDLPDVRGELLLRRFRSQPETAGIPVVVLTDDEDATSLVGRRGIEGVATVLRKPVRRATDVRAVVEAILAMRAAWGMAGAGLPADRAQAKLVFRLIFEGSTPLVFQLCRLLEIERAGGRPGRGMPTWSDIARLAGQECLVDEQEAQVLRAAGSRPEPDARDLRPVRSGPRHTGNPPPMTKEERGKLTRVHTWRAGGD